LQGNAHPAQPHVGQLPQLLSYGLLAFLLRLHLLLLLLLLLLAFLLRLHLLLLLLR